MTKILKTKNEWFRISNFEFRNSSEGGFGLIEIIIVTAIVAVALFGFLQAGIVSLKLLRAEKENLEASLLAEEVLEAVRSVRDESWAGNISWRPDNTSYYPTMVNGKWQLATSSVGLINGTYTASTSFSSVVRDAQDKIAASGASDSGTKKVTARVGWGSHQVTLTTYLTDFQSQLNPASEAKSVSYEGAATDADLGLFPSNNLGDGDPVQSFTTGSAITVTKVELLLKRATSTPSDIYVELRMSPTGTIVGTSQIITGTTIATSSPAWVEFRFPDSVTLNASTIYYIRLRSQPKATDAGSGSIGPINWSYTQTASSPYAGGTAIRYVGKLSNPNDAGQTMSQYDFGFRVYALQ